MFTAVLLTVFVCMGCQVRSSISGYVLRPHYSESAAGERERRRRLSGGQDDQPHETRSLHRHCECCSVKGSTDTLRDGAVTYAVFNATQLNPGLFCDVNTAIRLQTQQHVQSESVYITFSIAFYSVRLTLI